MAVEHQTLRQGIVLGLGIGGDRAGALFLHLTQFGAWIALPAEHPHGEAGALALPPHSAAIAVAVTPSVSYRTLAAAVMMLMFTRRGACRLRV